jgi:hypothetical protein
MNLKKKRPEATQRGEGHALPCTVCMHYMHSMYNVQCTVHYDANSGGQKWRENAVMFSLFAILKTVTMSTVQV